MNVENENEEMNNEIPIRQWLGKFRAGLRDPPKDFFDQFEDDWYDTFCGDGNEMRRHMLRFVKMVEAITDPYILDNYYIWFREHLMPIDGRQHDSIGFGPLSEERSGQYFLVKLRRNCRKRWSLRSERFGFYAPEFECANAFDMAKYIDGMGREFAQGIKPEFLAEKRAVERFVARQDGLLCEIGIFRAGKHRYRYWSSMNHRMRNAIVTSASGPIPDGFPVEQAKEFGGILVWSPDGLERDEEKQTSKKKEVER